MLFGNDRTQYRRFFQQAWAKHRERRPLEPLEAQVAELVALHPEYHAELEADEEGLEKDYSPEAGGPNPFLHLGMHLAIREQLATDRPAGIKTAFQQLASRLGDGHAAEHALMECLGEAMWNAQRSGLPPDENAYLECAKKLGR
jgi:hypothetical protein